MGGEEALVAVVAVAGEVAVGVVGEVAVGVVGDSSLVQSGKFKPGLLWVELTESVIAQSLAAADNTILDDFHLAGLGIISHF